MKNLIIIGAGGMGKDVYYIAKHSKGYGRDFKIKGFLDYPNPNWDTTIYPPIIGIEDTYNIIEDDVFVCSIGDVKLKHQICEKIKLRGGTFQTLIHEHVQLRENVRIGEGCIIDSFAIIGSDSIIGNNCLIQSFAVIAHDSRFGDYSRIDVRALIVGGVIVGNRVTIHTNAIVSHNVVIEDDATVGAMSFVFKKVKSGTSVFGCPAKQIY